MTTPGAGTQLVSLGAKKLVKQQQEALPRILSAVKSAGPSKYVKNDHYAWWVWPTTKPGISDPLQTSVSNLDDVTYVLAGPALSTWTALLSNFAEALRARRSRRVFPSIDHGRIDYFIKEWSSPSYISIVQRSAPEFGRAFEEFAKAWQHSK